MSDILKEFDRILEGQVHSVFFGRSALSTKRFATIRKGAGETVSTGKGHTCEEALRDAVRNMRGGTAEPVVAPGGAKTIVTRMPG